MSFVLSDERDAPAARTAPPTVTGLLSDVLVAAVMNSPRIRVTPYGHGVAVSLAPNRRAGLCCGTVTRYYVTSGITGGR